MTKREVIWLLIRLAGVYFLAKGLLMTLELLNVLLVPLAYDLPGLTFSSLIREQFSPLLVTLFYLALGLYLIYRGGVVFRVLNRQPDE